MKIETALTRAPKGMMSRTTSHGWMPPTPTVPSLMSASSTSAMPAMPPRTTPMPFQVRRYFPARNQTRAA
jgi:hypothetical protein